MQSPSLSTLVIHSKRFEDGLFCFTAHIPKGKAFSKCSAFPLRVLESIGQIPKSMGFKEVASIYLDDAQRRFVLTTYKYKVSVYKAFLDYHGDLPIEKKRSTCIQLVTLK